MNDLHIKMQAKLMEKLAEHNEKYEDIPFIVQVSPLWSSGACDTLAQSIEQVADLEVIVFQGEIQATDIEDTPFDK